MCDGLLCYEGGSFVCAQTREMCEAVFTTWTQTAVRLWLVNDLISARSRYATGGCKPEWMDTFDDNYA